MRLTLVRKALPTLLREAAAEQGTTLTLVHIPDSQGGRNAYRIGEGTAVYTPGETAEKLGVVWR